MIIAAFDEKLDWINDFTTINLFEKELQIIICRFPFANIPLSEKDTQVFNQFYLLNQHPQINGAPIRHFVILNGDQISSSTHELLL